METKLTLCFPLVLRSCDCVQVFKKLRPVEMGDLPAEADEDAALIEGGPGSNGEGANDEMEEGYNAGAKRQSHGKSIGNASAEGDMAGLARNHEKDAHKKQQQVTKQHKSQNTQVGAKQEAVNDAEMDKSDAESGEAHGKRTGKHDSGDQVESKKEDEHDDEPPRKQAKTAPKQSPLRARLAIPPLDECKTAANKIRSSARHKHIAGFSGSGRRRRELSVSTVAWTELDDVNLGDKFPYSYMPSASREVLRSTASLNFDSNAGQDLMGNLGAGSNYISLWGPQGSERYMEAISRGLAAEKGASLVIVDHVIESGKDSHDRGAKDDGRGADGAREKALSKAGSTMARLQEALRKAEQEGSAEEEDEKAEGMWPEEGGKGTDGEEDEEEDAAYCTNDEGIEENDNEQVSDRGNENQTKGRSGKGPGCENAGEEKQGEQDEEAKEGKDQIFEDRAEDGELKVGDRVKFLGAGRSTTSAAAASAVSRLVLDERAKARAKGPYYGARGRVAMTFEENKRYVGVRFDRLVPGGHNLGGECEPGHGFLCEARMMRRESDPGRNGSSRGEASVDQIFTSVNAAAANGPVVVHIRQADKAITGNSERAARFQEGAANEGARVLYMAATTLGTEQGEGNGASGGSPMGRGKGGHLVLPGGRGGGGGGGGCPGSVLDLSLFDSMRSEERGREAVRANKLGRMFPNRVGIHPPKEGKASRDWYKDMESDAAKTRSEKNRELIQKALQRCNARWENDSISQLDASGAELTEEWAERVVATAVACMGAAGEEKVGLKQLEKGLQQARELQTEGEPSKVDEHKAENEFERRLLGEVVPPSEVGVRLSDVGALENVKRALEEVVMLPMRRPELFRRGALAKQTKGVLLFGPPGTGKTLLAKAVATESGANFINVPVSAIASKWFGEGERSVRAVFTLAEKVAPSVVFVDEVDSLLGRRERTGEHEAMRKMKNEFMSAWDGLRSADPGSVLVLAATNRPFDLDEAAIRRLPRRILVDLPDYQAREQILRALLAQETLADDFDYAAVANATTDFSGSDLKNLCVTASFRPVRDVLSCEDAGGETPALRPLSSDDLLNARKEVGPSLGSADNPASSIGELHRFNEQYGEGGTRSSPNLSYFL